MSTFKCKMCGGTLEIQPGQTVAECEYCGTQQTLPKLDDDRRANLYDRANHFRRNNEFDKAMGIYEKILNEDNTDAESYWSLVLCRYGIEYVEDPATHKRVPTVNRAQYTSIFDDDNYKSALQYADSYQRGIYEAEAKAINEIQKGILAISQKEEPFDVFICYKETDNNGRRTPDSVLANDLYHQLTLEGFKVFFSRITLEDKLGSAYEPYIFAALNSAKVMVVLGTKPEYFNAVWVKNEWSRYLSLIRQGQKKVLVPAYKDMDPYDLPEEFSHLQAQDMGKLGFMQDLIRGIKKITQMDEPKTVVKETVVEKVAAASVSGSNIGALLERGNMALEDREWIKADKFFEEVLNQDAKNANAYLGKALAKKKCSTLDELTAYEDVSDVEMETKFLSPDTDHIQNAIAQYIAPGFVERETIEAMYKFDLSYLSNVAQRTNRYADIQEWWSEEKNLSRAEQFATAELAEEIHGARDRLFRQYEDAILQAQNEEQANLDALKTAYAQHLDAADDRAKAAYEDGERQRLPYYEKLAVTASISDSDTILTKTAAQFEALGDYKDSKNLAAQCRKRAVEERLKKEAKREQEDEQQRIAIEQRMLQKEQAAQAHKAKVRKLRIVANVLVAVLVVYIVYIGIIIPTANRREKYSDAVALMDAGNTVEAYEAFIELDVYKDSADKAKECKYLEALTLLDSGESYRAAKLFYDLGAYSDARERAFDLLQSGFIAAGNGYSVGLKSDGTVVAVGYNDDGQCDVETWTDIVSVATGYDHTVGLKSDGTVVAVGYNYYGQCDVETWTDIVFVAAGSGHTVGLKADGTVVAVGYNYYGQCDVDDWTDIVSVAAGYDHTVGLKSDGTVVAVGYKRYGQCDVETWTDIVAVAAGAYHTVGLKADGTVVAVGDNDDGQCDVDDWTDIVAIKTGGWHAVGLKTDGTVVAVGYNYYGQCDVGHWTDIVALAAGNLHTVGLKSDGTVVAVGDNGYGQCDVETWTDIKVHK